MGKEKLNTPKGPMTAKDIEKFIERRPKLTPAEQKESWGNFFKEQAEFVRSIRSMKGLLRSRYIHRGRVVI